jgi:hypothetical protein
MLSKAAHTWAPTGQQAVGKRTDCDKGGGAAAGGVYNVHRIDPAYVRIIAGLCCLPALLGAHLG